MSTVESLTSRHRYIPTSPNLRSLGKTQYTSEESIPGCTLSLRELHEQRFKKELPSAYSGVVEPSKRIQIAVERGKQLLVAELQKFGIHVLPSEMKVNYLPPQVYHPLFGSTSSGITVTGIREVFVLLSDEFDEYRVAATAFHELIHNWIDLHVHLLYQEDVQDRIEQTLRFDFRRFGLEVLYTGNKNLPVENSGFQHLGKFLNEVGNYFWEQHFVAHLVHDPELSQLFEDEFSHLNQCIIEEFGSDEREDQGCAILFNPEDETEQVNFFLARSNIWFTNQNEPSINEGIIISQIATELEKSIPQIDGKSLLSTFIEAKIHPRTQNKLRKAIDKIFGVGFYSTLRQVDSTSLKSVSKVLEHIQIKTRDLAEEKVGNVNRLHV